MIRLGMIGGETLGSRNPKVFRGLAVGSILFKQLSLGAITFAVLTSNGHAESDWVKLPTERYTLNDKQDAIAFSGMKRGWYGNGTGRVYRTDDGGSHWKMIWSRRGTYVRSLDFADDNLGFLGNIGPGYFPNVRDKQPLYITRDGGIHFDPVHLESGIAIVGICAIDVLKVDGRVAAIRAGGRVGGPATLTSSFDGGMTWQTRDMSGVTGMILDIKFLDADTGFIAGASEAAENKAHARILKTTDGGKTWRSVFESDRAGDNNWKLSFPSAKIGYATIISYQAPNNEARGYVLKTVDGGENWQRLIVTQNRDWIPYGIGFIDERRGFVGGSTGGFETRDGGATWKSVSLGFSVNKFRFVTRDDGSVAAYAIGQDLRRLIIP